MRKMKVFIVAANVFVGATYLAANPVYDTDQIYMGEGELEHLGSARLREMMDGQAPSSSLPAIVVGGSTDYNERLIRELRVRSVRLKALEKEIPQAQESSIDAGLQARLDGDNLTGARVGVSVIYIGGAIALFAQNWGWAIGLSVVFMLLLIAAVLLSPKARRSRQKADEEKYRLDSKLQERATHTERILRIGEDLKIQ